MKIKKIKLLTLEILATIVLSSTSTFASTNTMIHNNKIYTTQSLNVKKIGNAKISDIKPSDVDYYIYFSCNANGARVMSQPNANSAVLGLIDDGDEVYMWESDEGYDVNGFRKIIYNGGSAYVYASYLTSRE